MPANPKGSLWVKRRPYQSASGAHRSANGKALPTPGQHQRGVRACPAWMVSRTGICVNPRLSGLLPGEGMAELLNQAMTNQPEKTF
jgi:hypothetical protein